MDWLNDLGDNLLVKSSPSILPIQKKFQFSLNLNFIYKTLDACVFIYFEYTEIISSVTVWLWNSYTFSLSLASNTFRSSFLYFGLQLYNFIYSFFKKRKSLFFFYLKSFIQAIVSLKKLWFKVTLNLKKFVFGIQSLPILNIYSCVLLWFFKLSLRKNKLFKLF